MNSIQKTVQVKRWMARGLVAGLALMAGACVQIPSAYRGTFADASSGFQVQLSSSKGAWIRPDGSLEQFSTAKAGIKDLLVGKSAIYMRSIEGNQFEVFWVRPLVETRREEFGFVGFEAEVVYTRMAAKTPGRRPVPVILARHCDRGQVLIDTVSQSFNGGCPGDSRLLELERVVPKK